MSEQRQLRGISTYWLAWLGAVACTATPTTKPPRADSLHSFAVQHGKELENEINAGGGPNVRTLVILAKCPNVIDAARLLTQQKEAIYPASSTESAADRLVAVLASDPELGCSAAQDSAYREPGTLGKHGEAPATRAADRANMKERYGE